LKIAIRRSSSPKPSPVTFLVTGRRARAIVDPSLHHGENTRSAPPFRLQNREEPHEMPAMLPNAKCGTRAVPPATGTSRPFPLDRARMMMINHRLSPIRVRPRAAACAANSGSDIQPEPMIEVFGRPRWRPQPHLPLRPTPPLRLRWLQLPRLQYQFCHCVPFPLVPVGCHPRSDRRAVCG